MVRLSDTPGDSLLTAAKESAKSEGRARNLAILHCTEAFSLAPHLFPLRHCGDPLRRSPTRTIGNNALCNTIICNGFQPITCVAI
jgi:hypothetical protein